MTNINKKHFTWLLYAPIGTLLFYFVFIRLFSFKALPADYIPFLLLAIGVAAFPIRTKDSIFTLLGGVSLAVFVVFGLLPELVVTSTALAFTLYQANVRWDQHYRYAMNLLMVTVQSVVAAVFYSGTTAILAHLSADHLQVLPLGVYLLTQVFVNQFLHFVSAKYLYRKKNVKFFNEFLSFSLRTSLIILPVSFILIYLYFEMGLLGIVLGSLPFTIITIGMKHFYKSKSNNIILTDLTKYSQKLASKTNIDSVIDSFSYYLLKIFPSTQVIYLKVIHANQVKLERAYGQNEPVTYLNKEIYLKQDSILNKILETQTLTTYSKAGEWQRFLAEAISTPAESVILLPVNTLTAYKGLIVITHNQRGVYDDFLVSLVEVFYQYFLVVLENAFNFKKLEASSHTDHLTKLLNLRGFSKKIKEISKEGNHTSLSTIILDLDFFKKVNDEHGHETGNDVLKQVANLLDEFSNEDVFAARYGGEEFVLLLRNYGKKGAYAVAQEIRQKIEKTIFTSRHSIREKEEVKINITASLGVATYPNDCEDLYDLFPLADRVMYLQSKKEGRNKVTEFTKEGIKG